MKSVQMRQQFPNQECLDSYRDFPWSPDQGKSAAQDVLCGMCRVPGSLIAVTLKG